MTYSVPQRVAGCTKHPANNIEMHKILNIILVATAQLALLTSPLVTAQDLATTEIARDKALAAFADTLAEDSFAAAQETLDDALAMAAQDRKPEKIATAYLAAAEDFDRAELEAISRQLLGPAQQALQSAEEFKAKRYAPQTFAKAQQQIAAAETAVTTDRYATEAILALAMDAEYSAKQAARIAAIAREKPKPEQLLLRWDGYVEQLQDAAGITPDASDNAETATLELAEEITRLRTSEQMLTGELADSRAFVAAQADEIRELDQRLGGASAEREVLVLQLEDQARSEEQFGQTEALFDPTEGTVFRQSNNIVVRLFGLVFASGSAKLEESNQAMLDKIQRTVEIYPGATVVIEGHTDSQGSTRLNQRLSQNRADAVRTYLLENVPITPQRISAVGYGAGKPIANNETEEGRAQNRRIDLVITPVTN
jgi:OOP family OmpA-OmpF porin